MLRHRSHDIEDRMLLRFHGLEVENGDGRLKGFDARAQSAHERTDMDSRADTLQFLDEPRGVLIVKRNKNDGVAVALRRRRVHLARLLAGMAGSSSFAMALSISARMRTRRAVSWVAEVTR